MQRLLVLALIALAASHVSAASCSSSGGTTITTKCAAKEGTCSSTDATVRYSCPLGYYKDSTVSSGCQCKMPVPAGVNCTKSGMVDTCGAGNGEVRECNSEGMMNPYGDNKCYGVKMIGDKCKNSSECAPPRNCNNNGECESNIAAGGACKTNWDVCPLTQWCKPGASSDMGTCTALTADGGDARSMYSRGEDDSCASGWALEGKCVTYKFKNAAVGDKVPDAGFCKDCYAEGNFIDGWKCGDWVAKTNAWNSANLKGKDCNSDADCNTNSTANVGMCSCGFTDQNTKCYERNLCKGYYDSIFDASHTRWVNRASAKCEDTGNPGSIETNVNRLNDDTLCAVKLFAKGDILFRCKLFPNECELPCGACSVSAMSLVAVALLAIVNFFSSKLSA